MIKLIRKPSLSTVLMAPMLALFALTFLGHLMLAHAADAPTLTDSLLQIFADIKDKAVAAVVIMHIVNILRTHEVIGLLGKVGLQGKGLQLAIAILTAIGFVVDAYAKGGNLVQALIEGLFTAGGANLIYNATKANADPAAVA